MRLRRAGDALVGLLLAAACTGSDRPVPPAPAPPAAASGTASSATPSSATPSRTSSSPAPAPSASPPPTAAVADPDEPVTGFEQRRGTSWTTLAEERDFLDRLDERSDRVDVDTVGRTAEGRAIRLVVVGRRRSAARIRERGSVLLVCTQHGTEPAPREACLQQARDLAELVGGPTVLIVPTANPDGVAAGTRRNARGVDVNRTHPRSSAEARAIARVIERYRPQLLNDLHEYSSEGDHRVRVRSESSYADDVPRRTRRLSVELTERWQQPALEAAGFATGPYGSGVIESGLVATASQQRIVAALTETPRRGPLTPLQRVEAHRVSIDATLQMYAARRSELVTD